MSTAELVGAILGTLCFVVWVPCMISWVRNRVPIPRHIHVLAALATCVGAGLLIGMAVGGLLSLKLALSLVVLPPTLSYLGWYWMFGPEASQQPQ